MNNYRDNGAIGALLDEYERANNELIELIESISTNSLMKIVDHQTKDKDCISIQTVLTHVVSAGHNYVVEIRRSLGEEIDFFNKELLNSAGEYVSALKKMFAFNEKLFEDYPNIKLNEKDPEKQILVRWGQNYDVEQLFEHAIVHILRHRRQIDRFTLKLNQIKK